MSSTWTPVAGFVVSHLDLDGGMPVGMIEMFEKVLRDRIDNSFLVDPEEVLEAACDTLAADVLARRDETFYLAPLRLPFLVTFEQYFAVVVWAKFTGPDTLKRKPDYLKIRGPALSTVETRLPGMARDLLATLTTLKDVLCPSVMQSAQRFATSPKWQLVHRAGDGCSMRPAVILSTNDPFTQSYRLEAVCERRGPFNVYFIVDASLQTLDRRYAMAEDLKVQLYVAQQEKDQDRVLQLRKAYKKVVGDAMPFMAYAPADVALVMTILARAFALPQALIDILIGFLVEGPVPVAPPDHGHAHPVIATWRKVVADDESRPTHGHAVHRDRVRFPYLRYALTHLYVDPKHSGVTTMTKSLARWTPLGDFHDLETALRNMADTYPYYAVNVVLYLK